MKNKIIEKLDELNYSGCDVSSEISLFEYNLVSKEFDSGSLYFIYKIGEDQFDFSEMTKKEIDNIIFDSCLETKEVLSYVGMNLDKFNEQSYFQKVSDFVSYYGHENVFGTSCHPMTEQDLYAFLSKP